MSEPQKYNKILVLALSGIGDALMFSPAMDELRISLPDAQIDLLVMYKGVKDLYLNNPAVNKIIYFNFLKEGLFSSLKFIFSLRNKYDAAINVYPSNRKEYNVISFLTGAKKRVAVKYLRKNFLNFGFLNNVTVSEHDDQHNVITNIKLCEEFLGKKLNKSGGLKLILANDDLAKADKILRGMNISENDLVIGFHAGCSTLKNHINRRWEPEKFALLGRKLISEYNCKIILFGGPDEKNLKAKIKSLINSAAVFPIDDLSITESAAVMKRCNIFVSNDSGLMHIAAALNLKIVAIIGPTNIKYIYPWNTEYKVATLNLECSPCFFYSPKPLYCKRDDVQFKCIKELDVDLVANLLKELLIKI